MKKIGRGEYAYLVVREGSKVVHKYLGPAGSPQVKKKLAERKEVSSIPDRFRPLFWDTSPGNIHIRRNARYIIERVLEFGDNEAIAWLQRVYTTRTILDVLNTSRAISNKSRNFWEIWFEAGNA
ncbi:MAG: hypothetical protein WA610_12650 [Thermodesulfovibrionales bacterium]